MNIDNFQTTLINEADNEYNALRSQIGQLKTENVAMREEIKLLNSLLTPEGCFIDLTVHYVLYPIMLLVRHFRSTQSRPD